MTKFIITQLLPAFIIANIYLLIRKKTPFKFSQYLLEIAQFIIIFILVRFAVDYIYELLFA